MPHRRLLSFKYAFEGLRVAIKEEENLLIQFIIGLGGLFLGLYFGISTTDWLIGILSFSLVFCLELTNTAIEEIIDSFTVENHPGAKRAKDISAAAVMVGFFVEIIVGLIIFLPYLLKP